MPDKRRHSSSLEAAEMLSATDTNTDTEHNERFLGKPWPPPDSG